MAAWLNAYAANCGELPRDNGAFSGAPQAFFNKCPNRNFARFKRRSPPCNLLYFTCLYVFFAQEKM
jgi:hypothetical protein